MPTVATDGDGRDRSLGRRARPSRLRGVVRATRRAPQLPAARGAARDRRATPRAPRPRDLFRRTLGRSSPTRSWRVRPIPGPPPTRCSPPSTPDARPLSHRTPKMPGISRSANDSRHFRGDAGRAARLGGMTDTSLLTLERRDDGVAVDHARQRQGQRAVVGAARRAAGDRRGADRRPARCASSSPAASGSSPPAPTSPSSAGPTRRRRSPPGSTTRSMRRRDAPVRHRRGQRLRARWRLRAGARLRLPHRLGQGRVRPARDPARHHPRWRRHAAPGARGRGQPGEGALPHRASGARRGGAADRARRRGGAARRTARAGARAGGRGRRRRARRAGVDEAGDRRRPVGRRSPTGWRSSGPTSSRSSTPPTRGSVSPASSNTARARPTSPAAESTAGSTAGWAVHGTGLAVFDERRELVERHAPAEFVVLRRHAGRQVLVEADEFGAARRSPAACT